MDTLHCFKSSLDQNSKHRMANCVDPDEIACYKHSHLDFVCVEDLWPSQPTRVMLSSVYLAIHFPGQAFVPLKPSTSNCALSLARYRQLPFLNQQKGENDHRKYFMINFHKRILPKPGRDWTRNLMITRRTCIRPGHWGLFSSRFTVCRSISFGLQGWKGWPLKH